MKVDVVFVVFVVELVLPEVVQVEVEVDVVFVVVQ